MIRFKMEIFFHEAPLVRPKTCLLLKTIKERSEYTYLIKKYENKEEVFELGPKLNVKILPSCNLSENAIKTIIHCEMLKSDVKMDENLQKVIENGIIQYKGSLNIIKEFSKKIEELKKKESEILEAICFYFVNSEGEKVSDFADSSDD